MNEQKQIKTTLLCYIYKKINPYFWGNVLEAKNSFQEIFVFNCTDEPLSSSELSIKIINTDLENYPAIMTDFFYNKRYQADFLLILEDNESILFKESAENIFTNLKDDQAYNIQIAPLDYEVFDYETEPFTTIELRLLSFKMKEFKEILSRGDFFYQKSTYLLDFFLIKKKEIDSDFEIFKALRLGKEEMTVREHFNLAIAYFYKDSNISEANFLEVLERESEEQVNNSPKANVSIPDTYKYEALTLLLKLLLRRQEFNRVLELTEQYNSFAEKNPLFWVYKGLSHLEMNDSLKALKSLHKALKLRENVPFINNYSDLNWKLYSFIGNLFYGKQRYKNAEKYFILADECLTQRKSPEIYLSLAKLKFCLHNYDDSFIIFTKLFAQETIPLNILKSAKETFLILLLFVEFKEEFIDILSKDFFDKPEEILRIADTFYMNENFVESLKLYLLVVNKFGVENNILFKLGYICSKLRVLDQACQYFEKYLENEPSDLDALNNLAFLYLHLEQLEQAEKTYLEILKLNNYSFEANLHLAIIYMSQRNRIKAKQYLDKAKTLNPVSQEIIKLYKIFINEFK